MICRKCYKGHRYCSAICKKLGYEKNLKAAKKRFELSIEAKADHRDRQKKYLESLKFKKIVTDKLSKVLITDLLLSSPAMKTNFSCDCCMNCQRKVKLPDPRVGASTAPEELTAFSI